MLHRLTEWEDNGYQDSDFWASVFDDEVDQVKAILSGSTRFAGFANGGPDLGRPIADSEVLQRALALLADHIYTSIRAAEYRDVLEPKSVEMGTVVRLLKDKKERSGTVIPAGTAGTVFWSKAYGQFFRNGYNRPDRTNTRIGIRLADGETAFVPLSACRLHREADSDDTLRARALELSASCQFSKMTGERHAWDSNNYALALFKKMSGTETSSEEDKIAA